MAPYRHVSVLRALQEGAAYHSGLEYHICGHFYCNGNVSKSLASSPRVTVLDASVFERTIERGRQNLGLSTKSGVPS